MYSPVFHKDIADARIEDLRRAGGTSRQPHGSREHSDPRPAARWALLSRAGIRRLVFADPSRAN
jgi:hypothetical protein